MGNLLIRDVEEALMQRLKTRARINRTSLQHEATKALGQGATLTGAERLAIIDEARKAGRLPKVSITGEEIVRAIRDDEEGS